MREITYCTQIHPSTSVAGSVCSVNRPTASLSRHSTLLSFLCMQVIDFHAFRFLGSNDSSRHIANSCYLKVIWWLMTASVTETTPACGLTKAAATERKSGDWWQQRHGNEYRGLTKAASTADTWGGRRQQLLKRWCLIVNDSSWYREYTW